MYMSDSSIERGDAEKQDRKEGLKPKAIQWILIALTITTLFCIITIFILFSKLSTAQNNYSDLEDSVSSLNKQFKTNKYLNPLQFSTEWEKSFSLTPQILDSNTNYTDLTDSSSSHYFMWDTQSGGYGTCQFLLWIDNCINCQFSIMGAINRAALYPLKKITTSSNPRIAYQMNFNFVLAQGSNTFGISTALIGDPSQDPVSVTITSSPTCYVFGVQS